MTMYALLPLYDVGPITFAANGAPQSPIIVKQKSVSAGWFNGRKPNGRLYWFKSGEFAWLADYHTFDFTTFERIGAWSVEFDETGNVIGYRSVNREGTTSVYMFGVLSSKMTFRGEALSGLMRDWEDDGRLGREFHYVRGCAHGRAFERGNTPLFYWMKRGVSEAEYRALLPTETDLQQSLHISPAAARHICKFV